MIATAGEQILRTLGSSSEARVTVMRNGQQQDLTLNIAQVAQEADSLANQAAQSGAAAPSIPAEPRAGAPAALSRPTAIAGGQ